MNRPFVSELEELVLLCVGVLNPDAYAYGIKREIILKSLQKSNTKGYHKDKGSNGHLF